MNGMNSVLLILGTHTPRWCGIDFGFRNPFAAIWGHLQAPGTLLPPKGETINAYYEER
jgi:hypothetical protein